MHRSALCPKEHPRHKCVIIYTNVTAFMSTKMPLSMRIEMPICLLLLILLCIILPGASAQSVTIGNLNGAIIVPLTDLVIKQNDNNPSLPLYIEDANATEIILSCSLENDSSTPGLSGATFTSITVNNVGSIYVTNIQISPGSLKPGRLNPVTCSMQIPSQIMNISSATIPFQVTPAPYIVIPGTEIIIPNQKGDRTGQFVIKFSERLTGDATVNCSINLGPSGDLIFPEQVVSFGMTQYSYTYQIVVYSQSSYGVVCSMKSNITNPVPQFRYSTSQTDITMFRFDRGEISLTTDYQQITRQYVQFLMYKDEQLLTDRSFKPNCKINSFATYQQAMAYNSSLTCQPGYYGVTQAPTTTAASTRTSPSTTTLNAITTPAINNDTDMTIPKNNATTLASETTSAVPTTSTTPQQATVTTSTTQSTTSTTSGTTSTTIYPGTADRWVIDETSRTSILIIQPSSTVTYPVKEFITLTCCSTSASQRNEALEISEIYQVEITEQPTASPADVIEGYTMYENPAYIDIAPCPCDLTSYTCDPRCACDTDCSEEYLQINHDEIPGRFGGKGPPIADHFCNSSTKYDTPDWAPLLCTLNEKSAYLGLFYPEYPDLNSKQLIYDESGFVNRISSRKSTYSYESKENINRPYISSYRYGSDIHVRDGGILALPNSDKECMDQSPVRYLVPTDSGCSFAMTSGLCSTASRLNIYNYVLPPSTVSAHDFTRVLQRANSNDSVPVIANYSCVTPMDSSLQLCSWYDGVSPPPIPQLSGNTCQHSVTDVQYKINYDGVTIRSMEVQYIMMDIDLQTSVSSEQTESYYENNTYNQTVNGTNQTELISEQVLRNNVVTRTYTQQTIIVTKYQTNFVQAGVNTATKYAGRPGYNFDTTPFIAVLTPTEQLKLTDSLKLPLPGVNGLCVSSTTASITFPDSQTSYCQIQLNRTDFDDCVTLRYKIFESLELFYPVLAESFVSRFGVPNLNRRTHWVPIFKNFSDYSRPTNTTTAATDINNTTTQQMITTTAQQTTTSATQTTTTGSPTTTANLISVSGVCPRIPAAVSIQFLYANTGRSGGHVIWQITGAKMSISESEWRMGCYKADCTQKFNIQYSSQFTEVAIAPPPAKTRYQLSKAKESLQDEQPWRIDSFLYPIGRDVPEPFRASYIAMFLFIFSLFFAMFILSRPWWHKHYGSF